jgi:hypothetical protein
MTAPTLIDFAAVSNEPVVATLCTQEAFIFEDVHSGSRVQVLSGVDDVAVPWQWVAVDVKRPGLRLHACWIL